MPRLKALNRHWERHPPVHLLVASYLGYEPPEPDEPDDADSAAPISPMNTPWMSGMGGIPASDDVRNAETPEQALAGLERMFFGELKEIGRG